MMITVYYSLIYLPPVIVFYLRLNHHTGDGNWGGPGYAGNSTGLGRCLQNALAGVADCNCSVCRGNVQIRKFFADGFPLSFRMSVNETSIQMLANGKLRVWPKVLPRQLSRPTPWLFWIIRNICRALSCLPPVVWRIVFSCRWCWFCFGREQLWQASSLKWLGGCGMVNLTYTLFWMLPLLLGRRSIHDRHGRGDELPHSLASYGVGATFLMGKIKTRPKCFEQTF